MTRRQDIASGSLRMRGAAEADSAREHEVRIGWGGGAGARRMNGALCGFQWTGMVHCADWGAGVAEAIDS